MKFIKFRKQTATGTEFTIFNNDWIPGKFPRGFSTIFVPICCEIYRYGELLPPSMIYTSLVCFVPCKIKCDSIDIFLERLELYFRYFEVTS
jgi:hypothetical protein